MLIYLLLSFIYNLFIYYNASNYKVSCDSCPTCAACNIDTSKISSISSTSSSCPSGMTCTLDSTVSNARVNGAFSRNAKLLIIDNPSGLNGDVSIKMTYVKTTGAKHYFVILSQ